MNVILLGSGNVATHLGRALKLAGHNIVQVWSRTFKNAEILGAALQAMPVSDISKLSPDADVYILAVNDDAIKEVAASVPFRDKVIVHTSGSVDIDILKDFSGQYGVFYPLQTFSKQMEVDFHQVPLLLEGSSASVRELLNQLALSISKKVSFLTSEQRRVLHVSAVFACNFTNHLYALADNLMGKYGLDFDLLRPLILETANKVQTNAPKSVQTGPAIRQDRETIQTHLELLKDHAELHKLYQILSQSIVNLN